MHAAAQDGTAYGFAFDDMADFASYIQDTAPTGLRLALTPFQRARTPLRRGLECGARWGVAAWWCEQCARPAAAPGQGPGPGPTGLAARRAAAGVGAGAAVRAPGGRLHG